MEEEEEEERSKENKRSNGGGNMINAEAPVPAAWTRLASALDVKVAPYGRGGDDDCKPSLCQCLQPGGQYIVRIKGHSR